MRIVISGLLALVGGLFGFASGALLSPSVPSTAIVLGTTGGLLALLATDGFYALIRPRRSRTQRRTPRPRRTAPAAVPFATRLNTFLSHVERTPTSAPQRREEDRPLFRSDQAGTTRHAPKASSVIRRTLQRIRAILRGKARRSRTWWPWSG